MTDQQPKLCSLQLSKDQTKFVCLLMDVFHEIYPEFPEDFDEDFTQKGCKLDLGKCLDISTIFKRELRRMIEEEMITHLPTDKQIDDLWDDIGGYFNLYDEVRATVIHALKLWGTPEPIALKDRKPEPSDLDDEGCCWWWCEVHECWERFMGDIGSVQSLHAANSMNDYPHQYTHWLPHWAIKEPKSPQGDK